MQPTLSYLLLQARLEELRRQAGPGRAIAPTGHSANTPPSAPG